MIASTNKYENRTQLATALADRLARALSRAISQRGTATLAVSGGTTPQLLFQHLSQEDISWDKTTITLVDERQVSEDSPRSNARLVKRSLLKSKAASAQFVSLFKNETAASSLALDVVLLGMGEDGHTASFFPKGDTLMQALDMSSGVNLIPLKAEAAGEPRLTYTLPALLKARTICLHIEGPKKMSVLNAAIAGTDIMAMPIRAVLQSGNPIEIYWCP